MKTTLITLQEMDRLIAEYEKEVRDAYQNGRLTENTVRTYLLHSQNFVKWCHEEFIPGFKKRIIS